MWIVKIKMSYPSLDLSSDINAFRLQTHSSVMVPPYNMGPVADSCRDDCSSAPNAVPLLFQRLGQRNACCNEQISCAQINPSQGPAFPGYNLAAFSQDGYSRVPRGPDDMSIQFCNYARNARYVGTFGGKGYGNGRI